MRHLHCLPDDVTVRMSACMNSKAQGVSRGILGKYREEVSYSPTGDVFIVQVTIIKINIRLKGRDQKEKE